MRRTTAALTAGVGAALSAHGHERPVGWTAWEVAGSAPAGAVHEFDLRTAATLREFDSGDTPHEDNVTRDGKRTFHASRRSVHQPPNGWCTDAGRQSTSSERRALSACSTRSAYTFMFRTDVFRSLESCVLVCPPQVVRYQVAQPSTLG